MYTNVKINIIMGADTVEPEIKIADRFWGSQCLKYNSTDKTILCSKSL